MSTLFIQCSSARLLVSWLWQPGWLKFGLKDGHLGFSYSDNTSLPTASPIDIWRLNKSFPILSGHHMISSQSLTSHKPQEPRCSVICHSLCSYDRSLYWVGPRYHVITWHLYPMNGFPSLCTIVVVSVIGHNDHMIDRANYSTSVPCDSWGQSQQYTMNGYEWMSAINKKWLLRRRTCSSLL